MSTQTNTYVIYGWLFDMKQFEDADASINYDALEGYMDSPYNSETNPKDGLTVLFDGMGGKYVAVGRVVAKSDVYEGLYEPVSLDREPDFRGEVESAFAALLKTIKPKGLPELGWHVITHYR